MTSPHSRSYGSPFRRQRRTVDPGLFTIDINTRKENLPRPVGNVSVEDFYKILPDNEPGSPSKANSPSRRGTRNGETDFNAEKCAVRQFLWTTTDAILVRPQKIASSLPIPLAVFCTPFADYADSSSLPVSDTGAEDPLRCFRCHSYGNPFLKWHMRDSITLQCNMCGHYLQPSDTFLQDMDRSGRSVDEDNHPELAFGSVDFKTPMHYGATKEAGLKAPAVCFLLETSTEAVSSGFTFSVIHAIEQLLDNPVSPMQKQVCLVTFDSAVHFFVPTRTQRFRIVTMVDLEEPYAPVSSEAIYVDMRDEISRSMMIIMLKHLQETLAPQNISSRPSENSVAGGPGLRAALETLVKIGGGDLVIFHASTPSAGIGALKATAVDVKETCGLQQATFYEETLKICMQGGVAVSSVTAPQINTQLHIGTLQWLPCQTGGETLHFPSFSPSCTTELVDHLRHWAIKMQGSAYDCVFKLRCSKGLDCKSLIAPWSAASSSDQSRFEIPRMSADTTVTFTLCPECEDDPEEDNFYTSRDDKRKQHFVQAVILYTNSRGERLLRVHTSAINIVGNVRAVYSAISVAPLMTLFLKQAAKIALDRNPKAKFQPSEYLLEFCLQILATYYRHCCSSDVNIQVLALNKKLCLLPLYVLAARKFLYNLLSETQDKTQTDEFLRKILRMPIHSIMTALYPRIYALPTRVDEEADLPGPVPTLLDLVLDGRSPAYLITNGFGMYFYQANADNVSCGAVDPELWDEAQVLSRKLREAFEPYPEWMPLSELPNIPNTQKSKDSGAWKNKVFLSTIFVEDEVTDMAYSAWIHYLQGQVMRVLECMVAGG